MRSIATSSWPALRLTIRASTGRRHAPYVRRHLCAAHRLVRSPLKELSLALIGAPTMSRLHQRFLGIPGPTDVLTFPLDVDLRGRPVSGEVVVCTSVATRQARELGTDPRDELLLYALHGLLHLSGFDDRTAGDYARMHRTEDRILRRLGVGAVFDRRGRQGA